MATEFVGQTPVVTGIDTGRVTGWIKSAGRKLLTNKKHLIIGGAAIVILAAAGFYFWGGNAGGANVGVELSLAKGAKLIATGTPAWSGVEVTAVALASYTASVAACFDPGSWQFVSTTTGKPADLQEVQLYPPPEPRRTTDKKSRYAITASMRPASRWPAASPGSRRRMKASADSAGSTHTSDFV